jgi:hypothetical protein
VPRGAADGSALAWVEDNPRARQRSTVTAGGQCHSRPGAGRYSQLGPSVTLVVVFAVLGGLSPLEPPVDLVGVWVPPFAHPVLETR